MPLIMMTKMGVENLNSLDGSVRPMVLRFMEKLVEDDTLPGLRVKPLEGAADRRVRTARVNDDYRAVLFRGQNPDGQAVYHFVGVWPHDEGNRRAAELVFDFNAPLGVAEIDHAPGSASAQANEAELQAAYQKGLADAARRDNPLENYGWTVATLNAEAGIAEHWAEAALAAPTEEVLYQVAERMPDVQQLMLLDLAAGTPLEEAREKLGLPDAEEVEKLRGADEEERLAAGVRNAPSSFSFLGGTPQEVQRAFTDLTMEQWQLFLHPEQRRWVEHRGSGSFRLTGGAGTGKTVVLLHRAAHLHRQRPDARVLLTTYTRTLENALTRQLRQLDGSLRHSELGDPGLAMLGIDQVAHQVLTTAAPEHRQAAQAEIFGQGRNEFAQRLQDERSAWEEAADAVRPDLPPQLRGHAFLAQEYTSVVLAQRLTSVQEYARASRTGRGTRLGRKERIQLWRVFEQFRAMNLAADRVTYAEVTVLAAAVLESRARAGERHLADHVLVDEAQDFHAGHWQLLRALVAQGPDDLFIAEDSHQRIYGQKLTLKQFGIEIRGRSRRLKLNYRTTAQNLRYALSVLAGEQWQGLEENPEEPDELTSTDGYVSVHYGPEPQILAASTLKGEFDLAAEKLQSWLEAGTQASEIAVLVRSRRQVEDAASALAERGVPAQAIIRKRPKPDAVQIRTMHAAKGMEFRRVLLLGVSEEHLPAAYTMDSLPEAEKRDATQRERSLLYVAASRARDELAVVYSGTPSPMLSLPDQ
ncbi:3'-5' exonuclease [Nesterenkonia sp.]|uniref:3'-5' exonuclease n=1 Tax=Nesterenkonia sp. TaxID=704201 RepID=UPI002606ACE5|nr:3'-5' exonuclease [Nesterenkonia sp.]